MIIVIPSPFLCVSQSPMISQSILSASSTNLSRLSSSTRVLTLYVQIFTVAFFLFLFSVKQRPFGFNCLTSLPGCFPERNLLPCRLMLHLALNSTAFLLYFFIFYGFSTYPDTLVVGVLSGGFFIRGILPVGAALPVGG